MSESIQSVDERLERAIAGDLWDGGFVNVLTGLRDADVQLPYTVVFVPEMMPIPEIPQAGIYTATVEISHHSDAHADGSPSALVRGNHSARWGALLDWIMTDPMQGTLLQQSNVDGQWNTRVNANQGQGLQVQIDAWQVVRFSQEHEGKALISKVEIECKVIGQNYSPP